MSSSEMSTSKGMVVGQPQAAVQQLAPRLSPQVSLASRHRRQPDAMHYSLRVGGAQRVPNLLSCSAGRAGVFYRRLLFDFADALGNNAAVDLADFPGVDGLVRCDRLPIPEPGDCQVEERAVGYGAGRALLLDASDRQLALVGVHGWKDFLACREAGRGRERVTRATGTLSRAARDDGRRGSCFPRRSCRDRAGHPRCAFLPARA